MIWQARRLKGTQFVPHGRDPRIGLDCGGVIRAYRAAGYDMEDTEDYNVVPLSYTLLSMLRVNGEKIPVEDRVPGCCLALWLKHRKSPQHLAILTEKNTILHCSIKNGLVEEPLTWRWRRRIHSAWLPKESRWRLSL